MDFQFKTLTLAQAALEKADVLVLLVGAQPPSDKSVLAQIAAAARKAGDLGKEAGQCMLLYRPAGVAAAHLVLAALGEGSPAQVRSAVAAAVAACKAHQPKRLLVVFAESAGGSAIRAAVTAAADASYVYTTTKPKAPARSLRQVVIGDAQSAQGKAAVAEAAAVVAGVELAKEWGNRPANHATPSLLADAARALATSHASLKCEVLGPKDVAKLGMGAFAAVAQGSAEPLRFIVLRYQGAGKGDAPVLLVGKGITFDTGGVSLKPAAEMDEMKFDMCGAASVLGSFRALAELRPRLNVVGLIPACENMNDGRALKPGDVVTSLDGQTIEVLNTDAEGRLILCDALAYGRRFKPEVAIDIATLTGACVIALGGVRSGLFSSDDTLAGELLEAGERSLDRCWRMPLDDDYAEGLKTHFADVANIAGRAAGAVTAAKFLQRFVGDMRWAHLDIAGTAWKSGQAKGATGRPVGLLVSYLLAQAGKAAPSAPGPARRKAGKKA